MEEIKISKIIRSKRKTIALVLTHDAMLVIRAPLKTPVDYLENLVNEKRDWIRAKLLEIQSRPKPKAKEFVNGESFFCLGKSYNLEIVDSIGVDIELLKDFDFGVFRNCLSVSEEMYVNSGKEITQRLENFYEIWTRKEAYLKALGIGLQKPLPITQFYPDHVKPRAEIRHDNQQYYLSTLKEKKFILSVCTTRSTAYDQSHTKLTLDKLWSFVNDSKPTHLNIQNRQHN